MYASVLYIVGVSPVPCYFKATVLLGYHAVVASSHGCEEFSPRPWEDLVTAVTNQQNRGFEESVSAL
ncbi:hypothetical protein DXA11_05890 [Bacteroides sp. AM56-10ce]|nr:hypothetical protein DXA11_05890 [Bacteroides sp. AM56-10ce]RGZ13997.1 hypothetical protein DXA06_07970 [Bacteroides ovatus]RHK58292.1 hypothetical protein DW055_21190 [Bacteroides ovatus]